jgi:hypothetical protein
VAAPVPPEDFTLTPETESGKSKQPIDNERLTRLEDALRQEQDSMKNTSAIKLDTSVDG